MMDASAAILSAVEDTAEGPGRYMHRTREIALQKIIEASALARIHRALGSTTTVPGEVLDLKQLVS